MASPFSRKQLRDLHSAGDMGKRNEEKRWKNGEVFRNGWMQKRKKEVVGVVAAVIARGTRHCRGASR